MVAALGGYHHGKHENSNARMAGICARFSALAPRASKAKGWPLSAKRRPAPYPAGGSLNQ